MPHADDTVGRECAVKRSWEMRRQCCVCGMLPLWLLAIVLLGPAVPALAHHSGAGVDRTKTVTVPGIVKEFR